MDDTERIREELRDPDRLAALYEAELIEATPDDTLDRLTRLARRFLDVPVALVNVLDRDRQVTISSGNGEGPDPGQVTPLDESFCKYTVARQEPLIVEDARTEPALRDIPSVVAGDIVGYMGMPLITDEGHALGTLCVIDQEPREWTGGVIVTVEDLAESVTTEIELRMEIRRRRKLENKLKQRVTDRTADLEAAQREILGRLAAAAEHRDDETGKHTHRVGELSRALAETLGKGEQWAGMLGRAAPLHDLGKVGIPDDILLKEGPLDDEEFAVMKRHTVIGADLLSGGSSELVQLAETVARTHHERWDGDGYPEGLEGDKIPLAGRIVAVADAFDAMTHDRPYRPALSLDKVLDELRQERGRQFDPNVTEALLANRDDLLSRLDFLPSSLAEVA